MAYIYENIGEPSGKQIIPTEHPPMRRARFQCTVCKCNCVIDMGIYEIPPRWCPKEPEESRLRYAKWEEVK